MARVKKRHGEQIRLDNLFQVEQAPTGYIVYSNVMNASIEEKTKVQCFAQHRATSVAKSHFQGP